MKTGGMNDERVCATCRKLLIRSRGPDGKPDNHILELLDGTVIHAECVLKSLLVGKDDE